MTPRERKLALLALVAIAVVLGQTGFSKYRTVLRKAREDVVNLTDKVGQQKKKKLDGLVAQTKLEDLQKRSLSSDPDHAIQSYNTWLTQLVQQCRLKNNTIDLPRSSEPVKSVTVNRKQFPVLRQHNFKVTGTGSSEQIARFLDRFYHRELLHRISNLNLKPMGTRDQFQATFNIEVLALVDAPKKADLPGKDLPEDAPLSSAAIAFLNRNLMSPPNLPPKYVAKEKPETQVSKHFELVNPFEDPEGHLISYELVGEAPEGLKVEGNRLTWLPTTTGEFPLVIRARDNGWPAATVEQTITILVNEPPKEIVPQFDESRAAVLTGLVRNGESWQAWINLRTKGQTLRLGVGDPIKVGLIDGKIADISEEHATIEMPGRKVVVRPGQSLADGKPAG